MDRRLSFHSRGNRLRKSNRAGINQLGVGSFQPYQFAYQEWRDGGIRAMAKSVAEGKEVVAVTADISSYYHRLNPEFLLNDSFVREILNLELSPYQDKLNRLFTAALIEWSRQTGQTVGSSMVGIPVGLPASAVVANLALIELDRIALNTNPVYYGRYVDDILLAIETTEEFSDPSSLSSWIVERSDGLIRLRGDVIDGASAKMDESAGSLSFIPHYLASSQIHFGNSKNKIFHLSGASGQAVIESIRLNLQDRTSEWRSFSPLPEVGDRVSNALAFATTNVATKLRDFDLTSGRRQALSLRLRDLSVYERNLPANRWAKERLESIRAISEASLTLPRFFELEPYSVRLISLAAACADTDSLGVILDVLKTTVTLVRETCDMRLSGPQAGRVPVTEPRGQLQMQSLLVRWSEDYRDHLVESVISAWPARLSTKSWDVIRGLFRQHFESDQRPLKTIATVRKYQLEMMRRDLSHRPYRWSLLNIKNAPDLDPATSDDLVLPEELSEGADLLVKALRALPRRSDFNSKSQVPRLVGLQIDGSRNLGVVLPTRPPTISELETCLALTRPGVYGLAPSGIIQRVILGLRGAPGYPRMWLKRTAGRPPSIVSSTFKSRDSVRIAVAMLELDETDAFNAARGLPNDSLDRFDDLYKLAISVAKHPSRPDYLVLPEIAIPSKWFSDLATVLRRSDIGLISGIEHQPSRVGPPGSVTNQVWCALPIRNFGSQYSVYRQDKQCPAVPEKSKILEPNGLTLVPDVPWSIPPVILHDGFRFSLLICSELTNIEHRAALRGSVDALIVPEWNRDVHSFESLVESSALDLHAYIAQANCLGYGDSRIRAPMRESYRRDVVRLTGGTHSYFVVGDVAIKKLRQFHTSAPVTSDKPDFKPLPDGFRVHPDRRVD
ncbi:reverse transcriptase domain-containing protein [Gordonia sp. HS-NH1]|uniref:reverse transcriptase domain-containing protein n=1 Tax=Gordonia sp. HS-NH1 TaxID=1435068 RepID=UPI001E460426|nr:reverse transcriptase domain-containing protein [Gordonia sp. HS-NH1]